MKSEKPLPKSLGGAVCAQYRTIRGEVYGPYWFRFYREDGRLRKKYIRKENLEAVRRACQLGQFERRLKALRRKTNLLELRTVCEFKRDLKSLLEDVDRL